MKYILFIHQGTAATPSSPDEWARLSEDEQRAVYADYQAINETPGVTSGVHMQPPRDGDHRPGAGRQDAGHRRPVRRDQGGGRRYLLFEADDLDAAIELASRIPAARMGGAVEVRPLVEY